MNFGWELVILGAIVTGARLNALSAAVARTEPVIHVPIPLRIVVARLGGRSYYGRPWCIQWIKSAVTEPNGYVYAEVWIGWLQGREGNKEGFSKARVSSGVR